MVVAGAEGGYAITQCGELLGQGDSSGITVAIVRSIGRVDS